MKKVILAVMLMALALFLILPNLSWAQEDLYKAKCAGCHGADGRGSAAGKKMGAPDFSSDKVQSATDADSPISSKTADRRRKLPTLLQARVSARPMPPSWRLT
jgi:hypothetical protein